MDMGYIWLIIIFLLMVLGVYMRSSAWIKFLDKHKKNDRENK